MCTSDDDDYKTSPAPDTPADTNDSLERKRKKRKNTNVACVNCSRLHVSCEAKRPCLRCISKGLTATCVDAPRKKSKYLAGVPNRQLPMNIQPDHPPRKIMIPIYNNSSSNSTVNIQNIGEQQKFTSPQHIVHRAKFL
ncbi:ERT1-like protein [Saccharomyces kudriavzevii IFO 1802]|uniref:ERT1-like protein n=2 Tax=Saccharomyces TaxID=4930 RepID=J4TXE3_SACK1|nr:ERT1-like protein [Saccharomyces kudriavzevii IFO 1802]